MKKSIWLNLMFTVVLTASVTACTEKITERVAPGTSGDNDEELTGTDVTQKVRAEKLVVSAEGLLSPIGFFYADEILDEALKVDPNNRKAQFYKALLAPAMKMRGIRTRISRSSAAIKKRIEGSMEPYANVTGGLSEFLNAPGDGFVTEWDIVRLVEEIYRAQTQLAEFIKANKNLVTQLSQPVIFDSAKMLSECYVERLSTGTYRASPCTYQNFTSLKVNRGDWEAILLAWNGGRFFTALTASYDWTGWLSILEFKKGVRHPYYNIYIKPTDQEVADKVRNSAGLGRLRSNPLIAEAPATAADIYEGARWFLSMQEYFCSPSRHREHFVPGNYLCIVNQFNEKQSNLKMDNLVAVLGASLSGAGGTLQFIKPLVGRESGKSITEAQFDFLAVVKKPIADLKTMLPVEFDNCGNAKRYEDPTMGGAFPNGDAHEFILNNQIRQQGCHAQ